MLKYRVYVSLLLAGILTTLVVLQLFGYEDFAAGLHPILPTGMSQDAPAVVVLLVSSGVFGIPYLLPLRLSRPARWASLISEYFYLIAWLLLLVGGLHAGMAVSSMLLGTKINLRLGVAPILLVSVLLISLTLIVWKNQQAKRTDRE